MGTPSITLRTAIAGWLALWGAFVVWTAVCALPHNPLSPGLGMERHMRLLLPEGWGFFTRDAREKDLLIAHFGSSGQLRIEPPHAHVDNAFGLLRKTRVLAVEANQILSESQARFTPCRGSLADCLAQAPVQKLASNAARPYLCGDLALLRRAPVPWSWIGLLSADEMPTEVYRARIRCHHDAS